MCIRDRLWSCVDGAHTFLVSKPSGMSEEEAPASAYLRAVPEWQDLWGVGHCQLHCHHSTHTHTHTHNTSTCTHTCTDAMVIQSLQVYNYRYGTFMNICTNICRHNNIIIIKTQMWSNTFCGIFSCLVCGRLNYTLSRELNNFQWEHLRPRFSYEHAE